MDIKPQIVVMGDISGINQSNVDNYLKSGNWKHQRIAVVIPAGKSIPTKVALSHWNLVFPPNNLVMRLAAIGMEVGVAYSNTFKFILNHPELGKWEYILTLEHDNMPPVDGVLNLLRAADEHPEYTAVSGLYWTKGEGGVPQIWGSVSDYVMNFRPQPPLENQLQECCGIGMGFALWRIEKMKDKRLPDPLFQTKADATGMGTQDLMFWQEARKYGHRCAVDTRVRVGHYDSERDLVW